MTPPDDIDREELHHRSIDLRFYRRSDGLYEVVGTLTDVKRHAFRRPLAQEATRPGEPLHDLTLRLVIDDSMMVHDAIASMRRTPFDICPGAAGTVAALKGLRIGRGWNSKVRELLGGVASCTHLVELLGPMATTAFQGLAPQRNARINDPDRLAQRQAKVDSCWAYAAHRDVVARMWPSLHRPKHDA